MFTKFKKLFSKELNKNELQKHGKMLNVKDCKYKFFRNIENSNFIKGLYY